MNKKSILISIFIFSLLWLAVSVNAYTIQDFADYITQLFSIPQNNATTGGFDLFQWAQNLFQPLASSCCCYGSGGGASCTSSCYYNCAGSPCSTQSDCYQTSSSSTTTKSPCPYQCCTAANDPNYQSKPCTQGLCSNHQCAYQCTDSDGGDNPLSAGTCKSWAGSYSDACSGGTTFLQEQYCEPGSQTPTCTAKTYNCITHCTGLGYGSGSCSSGACHCQGSTSIPTSCVDACWTLGHYTGSTCSSTCSSGWIPATTGNQACSPNVCCCYAGTSSSSSTSSPPAGKCGNGIVDSGEVCDTGKTGYCQGCQFECHPYNVKEVCKADCSGYCSGYSDTGCSYQDSGVCDKNCGSDDQCAGKRLGDACGTGNGGTCSACKCTVFTASCQQLCNNVPGTSCAWGVCPSGTIPQPSGDGSCQNAGSGNRCCCGSTFSTTTTTTTSTTSTTTTAAPITKDDCIAKGKTESCEIINLIHFSKVISYVCKPEQGVDDSCNQGQCIQKITVNLCLFGCDNGKCKTLQGYVSVPLKLDMNLPQVDSLTLVVGSPVPNGIYVDDKSSITITPQKSGTITVVTFIFGGTTPVIASTIPVS